MGDFLNTAMNLRILLKEDHFFSRLSRRNVFQEIFLCTCKLAKCCGLSDVKEHAHKPDCYLGWV
jgi:hypothetical protein